MLDALETVMAEAEQRATQHQENVQAQTIEAAENVAEPEVEATVPAAIAPDVSTATAPAVVELKAPKPQPH
jgi:hypothetical protein